MRPRGASHGERARTARVVNALAGALLGFAVSPRLTLALDFDEPKGATRS